MKNKKGQITGIIAVILLLIAIVIIMGVVVYWLTAQNEYVDDPLICDESTCVLPVSMDNYQKFYYNQVHLNNYLLQELGINSTEKYSGEVFYEVNGVEHVIWCKQVTNNYNGGLMGCCKVGEIQRNATTIRFVNYTYNSCDDLQIIEISEDR